MDGDPHHTVTSFKTRSTRSAASAALSVQPPIPGIAATIPRNESSLLRSLLLTRGLVTPEQMRAAETAVTGISLSLGQVLLAQNVVTEAELLSTLSDIYAVGIADLSDEHAEPSLAPLIPAEAAIAAEAVIWKRTGSALVIATTRPDLVEGLRALFPEGQRLMTVLASQRHVMEAQRHLYGAELARKAEGRAPERHSCRTWRGAAMGRGIMAASVITLTMLLVAPIAFATLLFGIALTVFAANCALKFSAFAVSLRATLRPPDAAAPNAQFMRLPTVSIIVPLFREPEVAGALVARLCALDYPRERLDVILAVEETDPVTLDALKVGSLPPWMRAIIVPAGSPQTKPRALNYVLSYARGDIVGIYDAEDRAEPDQIQRVVQRFAEVPANVACLQGRLDYYNARYNGMSRLFAVEYAAWFRVLLPGVQRMGLVVPLGGTTLFLRRDVLEAVGAWDAHNVTEDAELGLRLARAGYLTEIVETTTFEEANAAVLPWIKQRSRWLKGYLMTWGAAMRDPRVLLQELGPWRFFWLQVQFGGAVLGFLTAPVLWSFMLKPFGLWHPLDAVLSPAAYGALAAFLVTGLLGSIAISFHACSAKHLRHLRPITPLVEPYYLLGTIAAWLGFFELMAKPFFWAKTTHGSFGEALTASEDTTDPTKTEI